jgi:2'-5' RNA ligase
MAQSVELILEAAIEEAIRSEWQRLAAAGLPSLERTSAGSEHRPHITLFAADAIPAEIDAALPELFARLDLTVRIGPMMVFGRRPGQLIMVRAVAGSPALLELQARTAALCRADPMGQFGAGLWFPHVTYARRMYHEQIGEAVRAIGADPNYLARVRHCRRWDGSRRTVRWLTQEPPRTNVR